MSGLEFHDKKSLAEFFQKTREFYPDSSIHVDAIFVSGDHVIGQDVSNYCRRAFLCRTDREGPCLAQGASILRTENGKITDWTDYYDGLTARRGRLAAYFTDWGEL